MTAGPNGALWFTNYGSNTIGEITTTGTVSNFTDPSISKPIDITTGPDGALWFTNQGNNSIGRITTGGSVTQLHERGDRQPLRDHVGPARRALVHQPEPVRDQFHRRHHHERHCEHVHGHPDHQPLRHHRGSRRRAVDHQPARADPGASNAIETMNAKRGGHAQLHGCESRLAGLHRFGLRRRPVVRQQRQRLHRAHHDVGHDLELHRPDHLGPHLDRRRRRRCVVVLEPDERFHRADHHGRDAGDQELQPDGSGAAKQP